ncbi:transglutaminase-like cysteine peptidase [Mangrovicella endophytica]|uniref:transglutaminase-like cysteine peptidase n=1 Tax=Mangrovicella endophytica TaxID=2066697 RepID=UPI001FDFCC8A|nr:transglutaminase-like cysteine peptidase [Mangrovicella endophytica]
MTVGKATTQPIGHYRFCLANPSECQAVTSPGLDDPLELTPTLIAAISAVNIATNAEIKPRSDREAFGVEEHWDYPTTGAGDCEDYALEKRRRLNKMGVALSNLLMTVVKKRDGTGHAILTLRTTHGDFELDNLDWRIRLWKETSYTYLKRQSVRNPGLWISIEDTGEDVLVGALKK